MTSSNIAKWVCFLAAMLLCPPASPAASAPVQKAARYEAVFADGTRVNGDRLFGWHEYPGSPRLDETALSDAKRPLRWLRDRSLRAWSPGENCLGYIEFVGGDRFVGRVVGFKGASDAGGEYVPAYLLVQPPPNRPDGRARRHVRILPDRIERVVFGSFSRRRLQPGAVFYRNGRRVRFISLRWGEDSVSLLLKDGMSEVKLLDIAEIHLPKIDPWRAYYRELAVLSPACRSRMLRIETTYGLIATGSELRFSAAPYFTREQEKQFAKALDALDKQFKTIQGKRKANQLKLDRARGEHQRQMAESAKQQQAERKTYLNAVAEMRRLSDELRKKGAAELASRKEQFDRELKALDQEIQDCLANAQVEELEETLETLVVRREQLRASGEKSLKDERLKLAAADEHRRQELDRFIKDRTRQLEQRTKELQDLVAARKKQLEEETLRWEAFVKQLESARTARDRYLEERTETWSHTLQPVWALDPMRVRFATIRTRWSFAPDQVPLCRVPPAAVVNPPLLPRTTNRNSAGSPLRSGGRQYAWGFSVHAYSELRFPLPRGASAFHSSIGLDHIVGPGGCVRARVYVGSTSDKPVYESPLLVGWKKIANTGRVALGAPPAGSRHLILQADPASNDSPPGADPLNIRDQLDWLDPRIEFDTAALRRQVRRQIGLLVGRSQDWTLDMDPRGVYAWTSRFDRKGIPGFERFWTMLRAEKQPLKVSREMTVKPADKWLAVHLGVPGGDQPAADTVVLNVGGRRVKPRKIPIRQEWQRWPAPIMFSLDEYKGKKIKLELTQPPGGKPLHWHAVSTLTVPPSAYRLVEIMEIVGKTDTQVSYELGMALQSGRLDKGEKLAAMEITEFGGMVNYPTPPAAGVPADQLGNVLVADDWKGGDKTFLANLETFKKMHSLKELLVTENSGVSKAAVAKVRAAIPKLSITRFIKRIPSPLKRADCQVTWRNLCDKNVLVVYVNANLTLQGSRRLKPGQVLKRPAWVGHSYEAHYDNATQSAHGHEYIWVLPISTHIIKPGAVWDIKPRGK